MKDAWGKWGPDDERGALNLITARGVQHAASLVTHGRTISLAQPISAAMAIPRHRPGFMHFMSRDGGDYAAGARKPGDFQFAEDTVVMPLHTGTHIDALCHCWTDDTLYNGFDANNVRSKGAARLGIDKLGPIATRGVLLDFVSLNGGQLAPDCTIGLTMVQDAIRQASVTLREGDAILLRTGWLEDQASDSEVNFNTEPGLDVEAATFLAECGVSIIGADNFAVEVLPFPEGTVFPVHQRLIRDYGIPLMEGLALQELAAQEAAEFLFVCAPLPILGATGSPVNPVVIL